MDGTSVFVVGASRSGTELVSAVLNRHPQVHIAAETHYFDDLRPRFDPGQITAPDPQTWARATAYFAALRGSAYGLNGTEGRAEVAAAEVASSAGLDGLFAAHCQAGAPPGTTVWGEKTPRHVFRAGEILAAFPGARLVAMVRDPRGVAASVRDWRNRWIDTDRAGAALAAAVRAEERRVRRTYSLTLSVLMWRAATAEALQLAARHGPERVLVLRFEDLVTAPEASIERLCRLAGVAPVPQMAAVHQINSSYAAPGAPGLRPEVTGRWRERLSRAECQHIDLLAGGLMDRLGYVRDIPGRAWGFGLREAAILGPRLVGALVANRHRIGDLRQFVAARMAALWPVGAGVGRDGARTR